MYPIININNLAVSFETVSCCCCCLNTVNIFRGQYVFKVEAPEVECR